MIEFIKHLGAFFLDFIETIVIALAIFVVVYLFLFQPHEVKGSSMYPNFMDGEYILTDKFSYRFSLPQRGDIIVFKSPQNKEIDFIKRIIGLPGDLIRISGGFVYVNDVRLSESSYLPSGYLTNGGAFLREGNTVTVPTAGYFVLGDNRNHSSDSREWGFVSSSDIIGKAWFRYWPISQIGGIPYAKYTLY
jgi:signal peptidase I